MIDTDLLEGKAAELVGAAKLLDGLASIPAVSDEGLILGADACLEVAANHLSDINDARKR